MSIHSHLPYDQSTSHARIPAGCHHLIASIDSASEAQVTASFFCSTKTSHGEVAIPSAATTTHNDSNQQYSITAVTTSAGAIAERYAYSVHGEPTICDASGSVIASSSINNRYSYTGREWDTTVGLFHFLARWMISKTGRFIARDPIVYLGSEWNLYAYVGSRSLKTNDRLGQYDTNVSDWPPFGSIPDQNQPDCVHVPLEKFITWHSTPPRTPIPEEIVEAMRKRGCIGLCSGAQAGNSGEPQENHPQNKAGTKCYKSPWKAGLIATDGCSKGLKPFVFAFQGVCANGEPNEHPIDHTVPNNSISVLPTWDPNRTPFNYVTVVNGIYICMNHGSSTQVAPQYVKVCKSRPFPKSGALVVFVVTHGFPR